MAVYMLPVALMACLGLGVGIVLLIASKRFAVQENPLVEDISEILPGSNCGACGFAGPRPECST